jgi:hypothetical protein
MKIKLLLTTLIVFLNIQQANAFIWLLGAGLVGHEIAQNNEKESERQREDIKIKNENQNRNITSQKAQLLAYCLNEYKTITGKDLKLNGDIDEKTGFCRGSVNFLKANKTKK